MRAVMYLSVGLMLSGTAWASAFDRYELSNPVQEEVRATITKMLKDPERAKFGELAAVKYPNGVIICGSVNARNSFGGYTGASPFVGELIGDMFKLQQFGGTDAEVFQVLARCQNAGAMPADL